jgi:SpoVK/Ycf46/Vps4 family AAA+-type ATPase
MSAMSDIPRTLVERIEPTARLADVALPAYVWRHLKEARSGVVLFQGLRGTGKAMAAHAIARELGTHLLRIDLSSLVSKYIGETEKHLTAVFAEAEQSGAVLLFEEADALFGQRSEVEDSQDRYANIEVSYLLQRLEDFDGIAILTTHRRSNLDAAFLRRLRFVVEFPPRS